MKNKIFTSIVLNIALVFITQAQQMVRIKAEPGKSFMINEIHAMLITDGEKTTVKFVAPLETRKPKYKEIDVQVDDEVIMVNGKKIKAAKDVEEAYKALKVGEILKLGIKRDGNAVLVSIEKADEKDMPKGMEIRREIGPDGKEKVTDGNGKEIKVINGKAIINGKEVDLSKPPKDAKIEIED